MSAAAIAADALRYGYPGGARALDGVSLTVAAGERLAVLGPNGAGKTTLMLHLNGLLRGEGGLEVAGLPVADDTLTALRARVGLVFQDPDDQLFMPTVGEDVAFGPRALGRDEPSVARAVDDALAAVGLRAVTERAPHTLSVGERRRAAIAGVLAMAPEILVLDEPSANLDPRARRDLIAVLDAVACTLVVVTHDLPLAAQTCDRAVVLAAGRVVADGRCREVLADDATLRAHDLELPAGFSLSAIPERRGAER